MPTIKIPDWMPKTAIVAILALQIWMVKSVIDLDKKADINSAIIQEKFEIIDSLQREMPTVLQALGDHGAELETVRKMSLSYTNELNSTRRELKTEIASQTAGRFTITDWAREKEALLLRYENLTDKIDALAEKIQ